jgi:two-component system cell cycle response regulator
MRNKILTVDDSKTVRIIIRKAFKAFDCEIFEAGNGVEGLAVATKGQPDIILLDVTMPVMDGVEMLTKLKADPALKGIPVIMLTAEGGRDNVLKIAKIGIRDYVIKPFKEEVLVEKVGRVIDLKPLADGPAKVRSILDPADILVVDDKPAIVQQVQEGLKHTAWRIHGASTQGEAIDFCSHTTPDLALVSMSLPSEAAFNLFRTLRANTKTKHMPIFGLAVKIDTAVQEAALQTGMSAVVTKPIDMGELESKIAKAMNLDMSRRYFELQSDFLLMRLPENCTASVLAEAGNYLKGKLAEAVDGGINKAVVDMHSVKAVDMGLIKLLLSTMQTCQELAVQFAFVGNAAVAAECKNFEDARSWSFFGSLDEAKAYIGKAATAESRQLAPA